MCRVRQSNEDRPKKFEIVSVYSCDGHLERNHCPVTTHSIRSRLISNIQTVTVYGSKYTHYCLLLHVSDLVGGRGWQRQQVGPPVQVDLEVNSYTNTLTSHTLLPAAQSFVQLSLRLSNYNKGIPMFRLLTWTIVLSRFINFDSLVIVGYIVDVFN